MNPVFVQHFLSELSTERGKTLHDFGRSAILLRVSCFLITRDKFLHIVADVRVGLHLVQESLNTRSVDTSGAWWAEIMA